MTTGPPPAARSLAAPLLATSVLAVALMLALVVALFVVRTNDLRDIQARAAAADSETRVAFCSFLATRAAAKGEPDDTTSARQRNDALAADAAALLAQFHCPQATPR